MFLKISSNKYNGEGSIEYEMQWFNVGCPKRFFSGDLKPDHLKSGLFEDWISNGPVFKGLGFPISDPIWNPNHFQTNLILTMWNQD